MAYRSNRCAPCDLNLPKSYKTCPVCRGETFEDDTDWSQSWQREADRLRAIRRWHETGQIPNAMVTIVEKDGRLYVAEELLYQAGYSPQEFNVVQIRGRYYELNGRVGDDEIVGWWLEPVDIDAEVEGLTEQLRVLTETEYQALDRERGLRE